ncbi:MBL fold metallo-hydrolase [Fulvimarina sp. 2208YS6-2-32]|uniref:MBL fold metallo-hydrolase n=1 Tax=Fulvimarina uroteuthidis TaxID=3098149 RepID=A0ABU5I516_9HYPH|nr:MBL fold metallo-hydrolase [Fulvimarina sp. 2208YS6-2-32]MDY8110491.1 MBL fold metallo-hydrolase [Fulvimarina sp. 2208YS6-2-32]
MSGDASEKRLRLTILGCSSSPGVPRMSGDWGNCDPSNPKNRRTRTAALVELIADTGITRLAIDCGPDFRAQMISARVDRLDALLLTHSHADHIHGIDDVRPFMQTQGRRIDIYGDAATFERVVAAFGYIFRTPRDSAYPPVAVRHVVEPGRAFSIDGPGGSIPIMPLSQIHGSIRSLGYRFGTLAYCTDVSAFPPQTEAGLQDLDHLVLGALQYRTHPSHFSLDQALGWIDRLRPKAATLTHMHTPLDYDTVQRQTPDHVQPGHDGLIIEVPFNSEP